MKILLIEDEVMLGDSIAAFLRMEGFLCEWVKTLDAAREKIQLYEYQCVLADVSLPDGNGLDVVLALKKAQPATGIIIISAKNALEDKVYGLDLGADDYLGKPFHLTELNSRIRSLIRRRYHEGSRSVSAGNIRMVPDQHEVYINEIPVAFTKKEFAVLLYFLSNRNRILTREAIAEHLWGDQADAMDSFDFIYSQIKNLRKKIVQAGGPDPIRSVYGTGYKFVAE